MNRKLIQTLTTAVDTRERPREEVPETPEAKNNNLLTTFISWKVWVVMVHMWAKHHISNKGWLNTMQGKVVNSRLGGNGKYYIYSKVH